MKDSEIRVCGRAAQTDSGAGGAVIFGCLAAAAVAGGFMTAGARLLLNASAVTSALSSVSRLLSPALNAAACLLLTLAVAALIAPPGQGMKRYYLLCALGKKRRASECVALFRGRRAFRALRLRIALAALNLALRIFSPAGRGACGGRDICRSFVPPSALRQRRRCSRGACSCSSRAAYSARARGSLLRRRNIYRPPSRISP